MNTGPSEYRIRLPQPWQTTTACVSDPNRADVRITTHEFRRIFQCPSGLDQNSHIAIEIQIQPDLNLPSSVACVLNDCDLTATSVISGQHRFAVGHDQLRAANNQLLVRLSWSANAPEAKLPNVALIL